MFMEIYPHLIWRADPQDYDCSSKTFEEWRQTGTVSLGLGVYFLTTGSFFTVVYLVVIAAMNHQSILSTPCYKLMYFNAYIELLNIIGNSLITGYLFLDGAVFCTHPLVAYLPSAFGLALWCASCVNCIAIAINRCCTTFRFGNSLFKGSRISYWLIGSLCVMPFMMFFTRQACFNSSQGAWFFTPYIEAEEAEMAKYHNYFHLGINVITAVLISGLYLVLCVVVRIKYRNKTGQDVMSTRQYKIFIQSAVVCLSNSFAAYIYAYIQFFDTTKAIGLLSSFSYQFCSAVPCIVYLALNKRIRNRSILIVNSFLPKKRKITPVILGYEQPS